jgi:hypothetical protein
VASTVNCLNRQRLNVKILNIAKLFNDKLRALLGYTGKAVNGLVYVLSLLN